MTDRWAKGEAYERYLGRWTAEVAPLFVRWVGSASPVHWLDVGCGTGALTRAILEFDTRNTLLSIGADPSQGFVRTARALVEDRRARFVVAPAEQLPFGTGAFDAVVSGLVLNFLLDPHRGLREMIRVCRPGGTVAGYVWDYTGQMWLLRHFWESAFDLVPEARDLKEVGRFALCRPEPLRELFAAADLSEIQVEPLGSTAEFRDFDDYWEPFLAGQGAAPSFVVSLPEPTRLALAEVLRQRLPARADGSITLALQVWAVRGRVR